jgi:transcriptional regulator with XRE-family HTH domain
MSDDEIKEKLGKRVREIRTEKGLTQHALAEKCGFTYSYIGGLERAEKNITLLNLYKVAMALDVGMYQFFLHSDNYKDSDLLIQEIVTLLEKHDPQTIEIARDVLDAMLKHMK